ncbi:MAG: hypothetical protein R6U65_09730 [Perlabentimonas sp.]
MAKRFTISVLILLLLTSTYGQDYSNLRRKLVELNADTLRIDTLSIIPNTFFLYDLNGNQIDSAKFNVDFGAAKIIATPSLQRNYDKVYAEYRVFPLLFEQDFFIRDYEQNLSPDSLMGREPPRYVVGRGSESIFDEQIQTQGSIMRGIRFGNNQDISVNSSMNLNFSGDIGSDLKIEGAISDQSVPIQPDGTTRRLEEFDRIFLRVYKDDFSVQAGDIEMRAGGEGQLLSFSRNVQGLAYGGTFASKTDTLNVEAVMAVPKGKFARNHFQGGEGNQGPYRLKGSNGEPFIIVLSGSERVYVDGTLLTRGEEHDYVIDYNSAEIIFTHRMPITRNSRIQVEFEYSERSYARFNTYVKVQHSGERWQWHISAFSEQDSRNQPFDQELTDEQKQHLANIGDNIQQAFMHQEDSIAFDSEKILYQKKDTLVNGQTYSIYSYSTNPNLAHYRVYFTFVGQGKGNYQPDFGDANGRVFRWVAPSNGELQGSYEPIKRLVPPEKRQMVQAGLTREWGKGSYITANYALSNTDLNTFSSLNAEDNIGHGLNISFRQSLLLSDDSSSVRFGANAHKTTQGFRTIDRFRPVEFERDWSIESPLLGNHEQMIGGWVELAKANRVHAKIIGENLSVGKWYNGFRGRVEGWSKHPILNTMWSASMVNASDTSVNTDFYKARVEANRIQGFFNFKVKAETENSTSHLTNVDSLLGRSFSWYQLSASVASPDTLNLWSELTYAYREDFKPFENNNTLVGASQEFSVNTRFTGKNSGNLTVSAGYRMFEPNKKMFESAEEMERTVLAQFEYSNRFFDGGWVISGGYELGSGLEPDAEYYFVEVPAGQGVFAWVDYNENGIRELNEFEVANYQDQARFIRINIPGSKMISVRNNALSIRSNISPAAFINNTGFFSNTISRFSNQTAFRINQKNQFDNFWESANPFVQNISDTLITSLSGNIRNSLAFNRASRKFGLEYIYNQGLNKSILANGYEQKEVLSHKAVLWLGLTKQITAKTEGEQSLNASKSQHFLNRNYEINEIKAQQTAKFISTKQHSIEVGYTWSTSVNQIGEEQELSSQSVFLQLNYVYASKGTVMINSRFVTNSYEGESQSSVAYQMMKGLQPGRNATWDVSVRRKLSKLFELELGYNGRYLDDGTIIHSGTMQARALF